MLRSSALICMVLACITGYGQTAKGKKTRFQKGITASPTAIFIGKITSDTLAVITGSTFRFTVDTPADQGLVSTRPSVKELLAQLVSLDGSIQQYEVVNKDDVVKREGLIEEGDRLVVISQGKTRSTYTITLTPMAVGGKLSVYPRQLTVNAARDLTLRFTAGQRSPDATVVIHLPPGIEATLENTTVNVIGRGTTSLKDLSIQSIGRAGSRYPYSKVGEVSVSKTSEGGSTLTFRHLDLRAANGEDLEIVIRSVKLPVAGEYSFRATYTTAQPEVLSSAGLGAEKTTLTAVNMIADFERVSNTSLLYEEKDDTYSRAAFRWTKGNGHAAIQLMQSTDQGNVWRRSNAVVDTEHAIATVSGLLPDKLYSFRLAVGEGKHQEFSNLAHFYSGKLDVKSFGAVADGHQDDTEKINEAIAYLAGIGGGTLLFSEGTYNVRTVHLRSHVYLYVDKGAVIRAIKGADAPETTWFSDKEYRSGLSPTDTGPYEDPENYLTKQDVGHHYFRNTMFFGERLNNVKIIGNGLITGNGNLVTGDRVMNNAPDNRADKMFTLKLCTNVEIGGLYRANDLWYDQDKDAPYYIDNDGAKNYDTGNMLNIDRAGHFALLATGSDNIHVHDTYFAQYNTGNARDIYDFMECNNVTAANIYSKVSSDDIVKLGSDCALGFTRPARNYKVRNIIGDTNCNLLQIGSETADDIQDVHVDNIFVTGANKAGFSISTNDGGHIKDIHLNCGHTGPIHSRSKMYRATTPFFISISNRGRVLGADAGKYVFTENGQRHEELLVKNVNIGQVENIILNHIDVTEVYSGSSYSGNRWKVYDGSQKRASPIIAGYKLPDTREVEGGLDFILPNGKHTGYIQNIEFKDVHVVVKGGNPVADTAQAPPELGVGQYNVSNLKIQPAYGIWARHVSGLLVEDCTFNYEKRDSRYAIFLDDVRGAKFNSVKFVRAQDNAHVIKLKKATGITLENIIYYHDEWNNAPVALPRVNQVSGKDLSFPEMK
ncbi:MAG: endopygalactorunase [Bacteroidota bacterium]